MLQRAIIGFLMLGLFGCAHNIQRGETKTIIVRETANELDKQPVPGTQTEPWVEPMPEVVRTPAAIDRKGVYFRPAHNEIVEVRPEKFQKVEYPDFDGKYPNHR